MTEEGKMNRGDIITKRGRAQHFLNEVLANKPDHTQLSILRDKYGYNCPTVEVMKLKYDEVKLLSKEQQSPAPK